MYIPEHHLLFEIWVTIPFTFPIGITVLVQYIRNFQLFLLVIVT